MKRKSLHIPLRTVTDYVRLMAAFHATDHPALTEKEIEILAAFIVIEIQLRKKGILANAFAPPMRKKVSSQMGFSTPASLGNYVKALADKGAIEKMEGGYRILDLFLPEGENEILITIR